MPVALVAMVGVCSSCGNPGVPDDPKPEGPWVDQLMHYEAIEYDPDFKLLDYRYYVKVSSQAQVEQLYAEMTDLDNYIPSYPYNDDFQTVAIRTVRENIDNHWRPSLDSAHYEVNKKEIRRLLNTYPQTIELTWEHKGFQFKTIGILSVNTNLIVYEPVDQFLMRGYSRTVKVVLPRTRSTVPEEMAELKYSINHDIEYLDNSTRITAGITYTVYGQYIRGDHLYKQIVSSRVSEWTNNPDSTVYQVLFGSHQDPIIPGDHSSTSFAYACAIGYVGHGLTANYVGGNEGFRVSHALESTSGYDHITADLLEKDK